MKVVLSLIIFWQVAGTIKRQYNIYVMSINMASWAHFAIETLL